jgi:hypothetical protein
MAPQLIKVSSVKAVNENTKAPDKNGSIRIKTNKPLNRILSCQIT